jgi:hypothetical protein
MNEQIMGILRVLAEKFGTTTEFLWGIMVKQAYVYGITSIFVFAVTSVLIFGWNYLVFRYEIPEDDDGDARFGTYMCRLGGLMLIFIWTCLFLSGMHDVSTALINPEYWALKQVIGK